ncbi:hypothetical protein ES319_A07G209900v1 [Gossypium barbadense]|uniref:Uncharacterized protein n=2 Tax=Gossypium TaxID=3633 RepID=A0A5J5V5W5_GOSBA|nr:hypothetical protein ES319_A07G209900v1 [Gossypium barbadense]TYH11050.1 hypothetical protein ES288_A07G227900v1 [Gossypium darwinii]
MVLHPKLPSQGNKAYHPLFSLSYLQIRFLHSLLISVLAHLLWFLSDLTRIPCRILSTQVLHPKLLRARIYGIGHRARICIAMATEATGFSALFIYKWC